MTKLITLFISLGCIATIANAQIEKGMTFLGGQIFYYNSDIDFSTNQVNQKNRYATFSISVGKALTTNNVFGVNLSYSPGSEKNFYNGAYYENTESHFYSPGLFYRHYKTLATDFYFFIEAGLSYSNWKQVSRDTAGTNLMTVTQSGGQFTVTPGISYRIYKRLHLELLIPNLVTLQYTTTKEVRPTLTQKQNQFLVNTSLNANSSVFLGVGFRFIF